jgi:hypothetical protein
VEIAFDAQKTHPVPLDKQAYVYQESFDSDYITPIDMPEPSQAKDIPLSLFKLTTLKSGTTILGYSFNHILGGCLLQYFRYICLYGPSEQPMRLELWDSFLRP